MSENTKEQLFHLTWIQEICLVENEKCPAETHKKYTLYNMLELVGHRMYFTFV